MNNTGFIVIHRQMLEWEWHDDPNTMAVWIHILLLANWKPNKWHGIEIPRGSCLVTLADLAKHAGMTVQNVRTALKHLKSTGELTCQVTRYGLLINVLKYSDFQDFPDEANTPNNTLSNTELTRNQHGTNTELTTLEQSNKETKKQRRERVEREGDPSSPSLPPTLREISDFIGEEGLNVDPPKFWKYYSEWGKPFPADWQTRCRRWSETEHVHSQQQQNVVIDGPEWLKHMDVKIDKEKIDF